MMTAQPDATPLLRVQRLCVTFQSRGLTVRAVDDVSLELHAGRTLGLVGESGCGKTTLGRAILRLVPVASGDVFVDGRSMMTMHRRELRMMRRSMQMIFQDPAGSLNPRMMVGEIVGEPLLVHGVARGVELRRRVEALLEKCGMPHGAADRRPHEFSGGQRQRIGIARALALNPRLIVCDEPTSALDVSVQSQILNLLRDLQEEFGMAYLFISHDMAVVAHMCDCIAVMQEGRIVESGDRDQVLFEPRHAYTQRLLDAVPGRAAARPQLAV